MPTPFDPADAVRQPDRGPTHVSGRLLVSLGIAALLVTIAGIWLLAEIVTKPNVGLSTVDLGGMGRTVGLIAAAAIGLPAAVLAYHRQRALDTANHVAAIQHQHKVHTDNREHRVGVERHLRERYTTCAEQLGHDSSAIRLAGVYALASLADDWHDFDNDSERQVCIDLLCAYLRNDRQPPIDMAEQPEDRLNGELQNHWIARHKEERQVRSAIIEAIRSRTQVNGIRLAGGEWLQCHFDLAGASLVLANLISANLISANLISANLISANLAYASLSGVNLTDARLHRANLTGANLTNANLTGANLTDAVLTNADLTGADLTDAVLTNADLTGAVLTNANRDFVA